MNPVNLQGFQGFLLAKLLLLGELAAFHQVPDCQKLSSRILGQHLIPLFSSPYYLWYLIFRL